MKTEKKESVTQPVSETTLLSAAECARLCGVNGPVSSDELNEQIVKFLWYLCAGFKRGASPWVQSEAELRAMYSERHPTASDYRVLHPANRKKDLS